MVATAGTTASDPSGNAGPFRGGKGIFFGPDNSTIVCFWRDDSELHYSIYTGTWGTETKFDDFHRNPFEAVQTSNGDIHVIFKRTSTVVSHKAFVWGGSSYSLGTTHTVYTAGGDVGNEDRNSLSCALGADGVIRVLAYEWTGAVERYNTYYSTDAGDTWNVSIASMGMTWAGTGQMNAMGQVDDYTFIVGQSSDDWAWRQRQDADTETAWVTEATDANQGDWDDYQTARLMQDADGKLHRVISHTSDARIRDYLLTPGSPSTWGSGTDLGNATDIWPALCVDPSNEALFLVFCDYQAANDYDIVYREYPNSGSGWAAQAAVSATTAANRLQPVCAVSPNGVTLAVAWAEGTSTPWNIQVETVTVGTAAATMLPRSLNINQAVNRAASW